MRPNKCASTSATALPAICRRRERALTLFFWPIILEERKTMDEITVAAILLASEECRVRGIFMRPHEAMQFVHAHGGRLYRSPRGWFRAVSAVVARLVVEERWAERHNVVCAFVNTAGHHPYPCNCRLEGGTEDPWGLTPGCQCANCIRDRAA